MTIKAEILKEIEELKKLANAMPDDPEPLTGRVLDNDYTGNAFTLLSSGSITHSLASPIHIYFGAKFYDEESTKRYKRYLELVQQMRVIAAQYEPCDWGDKKQNKYHIQFDPDEPTLGIGVRVYTKVIGTIYSTDSEALEDFIKGLSEYDRECLIWGNN